MFNILFVFFKNLLPISFPRPLITVNLSQCKKFHFNSTTVVVIVVEMIFLKKYLAYFLMGVQNLWNHFICNRHKNFFSLLFAKSKFKVFSGRKTFQLFSTIIRQISHLQDFTLKKVKAKLSIWRYQPKVWNCFLPCPCKD